MFTTRFRTSLASIVTAALVATSAALLAAPASAEYRVEVRDGPAFRHEGHRDDWRRHGGHRDDWRRHGGHRGDWRRHVCEPREAIAKARSRGMRHPDIRRLTRGEIIVAGRHRGHRALMVFERFGRGCRVIAARGI